MELKRNERVVFYKEDHHYELDGIKFLKGVTTLLKDHGLAPSEYASIDSNVLHEAALKGTAVHEMLETYDNGETVVFADVKNEDGVVLMTASDLKKTLNAYKKKSFHILFSEWLVSDNDIIASSIDKVEYTDVDGEYNLVDIKTSSDPKHESYVWQLSIYAYLFERQHPGAKVANLIVRHIRDCKVKDYPVNRIPDAEVEKLLNCERMGLQYFTDDTTTGSLESVINEKQVIALKNAIGNLMALEVQAKQAQEVIDGMKDQLLSYMESKGIKELESNGVVAKFKAGYERLSIDSAKLKKLYPDIAEECSKVAMVKGSITFNLI